MAPPLNVWMIAHHHSLPVSNRRGGGALGSVRRHTRAGAPPPARTTGPGCLPAPPAAPDSRSSSLGPRAPAPAPADSRSRTGPGEIGGRADLRPLVFHRRPARDHGSRPAPPGVHPGAGPPGVGRGAWRADGVTRCFRATGPPAGQRDRRCRPVPEAGVPAADTPRHRPRHDTDHRRTPTAAGHRWRAARRRRGGERPGPPTPEPGRTPCRTCRAPGTAGRTPRRGPPGRRRRTSGDGRTRRTRPRRTRRWAHP